MTITWDTKDAYVLTLAAVREREAPRSDNPTADLEHDDLQYRMDIVVLSPKGGESEERVPSAVAMFSDLPALTGSDSEVGQEAHWQWVGDNQWTSRELAKEENDLELRRAWEELEEVKSKLRNSPAHRVREREQYLYDVIERFQRWYREHGFELPPPSNIDPMEAQLMERHLVSLAPTKREFFERRTRLLAGILAREGTGLVQVATLLQMVAYEESRNPYSTANPDPTRPEETIRGYYAYQCKAAGLRPLTTIGDFQRFVATFDWLSNRY